MLQKVFFNFQISRNLFLLLISYRPVIDTLDLF